MKLELALLSVLILFISGCSKEGIIEEEKFVNVYSDLLIAGDTASVKIAKDVVFKRYNIKKQQYEKTLEYYNSNPELWDPFFEKVIAHIERLKQNPSSPL